MRTITTKYTGPTDTRGARITARSGGYRITVPYPYEASMGEDAHRVAAEALARAHHWKLARKAERLPAGTGYTFHAEEAA